MSSKENVKSTRDKLFGCYSSDHTIVIQEIEGFTSNELYDASSTYLRTRISSTMRRLKASKNEDKNNITLSLDNGKELVDAFQGVGYKWKLISKQENQGGNRGGDFRMMCVTKKILPY